MPTRGRGAKPLGDWDGVAGVGLAAAGDVNEEGAPTDDGIGETAVGELTLMVSEVDSPVSKLVLEEVLRVGALMMRRIARSETLASRGSPSSPGRGMRDGRASSLL